MSKAFSVFYDHLLPELPGCTTALADLHLLQVARDFCNRTSAWRGDFDPIDSETDTLTYQLDAPEARAECVRALSLTVNEQLLWTPVDPPHDQDQPQFPNERPPFSINGDGDEITLEEQPSGVIQLVGSMRPAGTATSLPDLLYTEYLEAMRTGTLARLMAMPKKHWSDREQAAMYRSEYLAKTNFAATKAAGGNTRQPLRTRKWG